MKIKFISALLLIVIIGFRCTSDPTEDDREEIKAYLSSNAIQAIDTLGVFISITTAGEQTKPTVDSTVTLSYNGRYLDGEIFDRVEETSPIKLKVKQAISGLRTGLQFFGKDGIGTIFLPADQGFGGNPPFGVRKDAILVYEIKIHGI